MKIKVYADADAVALEAAKLIAKAAQDAVAVRGKFVMAVSGGKTPWIMLRDLARHEVPWNGVHVVQVDERIAPEGDLDRNRPQFGRQQNDSAAGVQNEARRNQELRRPGPVML